MKRLTRKEVQEGLKQIPIERILIGKAESPKTRLTPKQIRFAEQIALGETKAGAYRKSRETKAKPVTASRRGQDLMKNSAIVAQVEAFKLAQEAERLRTPAQLRALTIQKLTEGALNEEFPPAQRVKCLELLGKITEVALFTERREIIKTTDSAQIKERLIKSLISAMGKDSNRYKDGDSLLAELTGGVVDVEASEPHRQATPQVAFDSPMASKHTNPHIQSNEEASDQSAHLPNDFSDTGENLEVSLEVSPVHSEQVTKAL